ncbi:MAG: sigma-70 family RNA polymerase sigma factor [Clostridiaceae bacterium]|nr:sigma-70 family RNA polymerase sigma factor [Clostridiaceae bacterium]
MKQAQFIGVANKYKDTVFRVALNYLGNTYDAEDMMQEVFMKLFNSKNEFMSDEHIRHWLIRVTINLCKNSLRAPWKRRHVPIDELKASFVFEHEEQSAIFSAVMELKEKYRTVLYLFYYEDLTVKEISSMLNIKESAVTTRLSRAREQLKHKLKEVWQDEF